MSTPEAAAPGAAPLNAEFLPPHLRKHVDPASPAPLRMMGAKALVPLAPSDMLGALYLLTFDPDPGVRETAARTAAGLPDRILGTGLRDEGLQPPVLGYFLRALKGKDPYVEPLVLNPATPDDAVAEVARECSAKLCELVGQNQLRLLRHDDIIRGLCQNPNASGALVDSVCDFAVRSGVQLLDVPQMQAARVRVFGPQAAAHPPDPGPTAEEVLREFEELQGDDTAPLEEGKRLTLTQRILKMNVSEKIKLATLGNKEARGHLIRDSNKLVAVAVVRSPRITDGEVLSLASNRAVHDDVLRIIYANREWVKKHPIKLALVKHPKVPLTIAMKFLSTLRETEVRDLSRDKNVPSGVQMMARKLFEARNKPKESK